MKTGIILTNVGTPDSPTPTAVRSFLRDFLSDRRVVEMPRFVWLPILYGIILTTRPRASAKLYKKIWTDQGSPLLVYSQLIAHKLEEKLQCPVVLGMNYGNPSIQNALEELRAKSVDKIIVLPLFPQYSATTTAASFDIVAASLKTWRVLPAIEVINQYATNESYIASLTHSIKTFWSAHGQAPHLLFSFHGIPERFVNSGDPYPEWCHATARLVAEQLNLSANQWSVSFQSRLGRAKWLTPYTEHVLSALPKNGTTHLQVVCPGFAVDCLETLEEIAIRGKKQFIEAGGKIFEYIPALNDSDEQVNTLAKVIFPNIV